MLRMSKLERVTDIAQRCNMSEDIVRAVLKAERDSMMDSLKKGEKVTLPGRVIINPIIKRTPCIDSNGEVASAKYVSATAKPISSVFDELKALSGFEQTDTDFAEDSDLAEQLKKHKIQVLEIPMLE